MKEKIEEIIFIDLMHLYALLACTNIYNEFTTLKLAFENFKKLLINSHPTNEKQDSIQANTKAFQSNMTSVIKKLSDIKVKQKIEATVNWICEDPGKMFELMDADFNKEDPESDDKIGNDWQAYLAYLEEKLLKNPNLNKLDNILKAIQQSNAEKDTEDKKYIMEIINSGLDKYENYGNKFLFFSKHSERQTVINDLKKNLANVSDVQKAIQCIKAARIKTEEHHKKNSLAGKWGITRSRLAEELQNIENSLVQKYPTSHKKN